MLSIDSLRQEEPRLPTEGEHSLGMCQGGLLERRPPILQIGPVDARKPSIQQSSDMGHGIERRVLNLTAVSNAKKLLASKQWLVPRRYPKQFGYGVTLP